MVKRMICVLLCLLIFPCALCESTVERREGERYFPSEEEWTYHFTYAYPFLPDGDLFSAMVNDTYEMVLNEMIYTSLPMFADSADLDGYKAEVRHDFRVTCNNGRFLSIVQLRSQTLEDGGEMLVMEPLTFDVTGEYMGETLTLRGLVMVGESSVQLSEALMPLLYDEFQQLQARGIARADVTREDFYAEFSPMSHFYADEAGSAVFFFPPMLMEEPSFDPPVFVYTPAQLQALVE